MKKGKNMLETIIVICVFGLGVYAGKRREIGCTWREIVCELYNDTINYFASILSVFDKSIKKERNSLSSKKSQSNL